MDEIKITKWSGPASAGHEVFNVQRAPNGTWVSAATNEVLDLGVALHVTPDGALWIETLDGESPLDEILRYLPRGHGYSGWAYDRSLPETGIDAIDTLEDDGGIPVFVDFLTIFGDPIRYVTRPFTSLFFPRMPSIPTS